MPTDDQLKAFGYFGKGPDNDHIQAMSSQGQKTYEKARYGRPQFGFPDVSQDQVDRGRLFDVLMGAGAGAEAGAGSASPFGALARGLSGGIQTSRSAQAQREASALQRRKMDTEDAEQMLNMAPVGQVSPVMAKALMDKYGMDVSDIPMGQFQKFSGLLTKADDMEKQLALIQARYGAQLNLQEARETGKVDRFAVDAKAAKNYEMTYRIPADFFEGRDRRDVNAQLAGFKPYQKQAEALIQAQNQVNVLKAKWAEVQGDVGIVEGSIRKASGGYGGKQNAKLSAYESARTAAVTSIRKLFADSGAPSNFDVARYTEALPGASTNRAKAIENWDFLDQSNNSGKASLVQASPLTEYIFNPQAQTAQRDVGQGGGMVRMVAPNGEAFQVPAANVAAAEKRGARRK